MVMGMGMGVGFSSPPPWTPAALSPSLWLGAYEEARATRGAAPNLLDGACQDVTKWTAHSGAALSNQPGGVSGNCMRVAFGGSANPLAGQDIGIVGNRYRATGSFRGDGAKPPEVLVYNSLALGLASNAWQSFAADQTMGPSGIFGVRCTTAAAGYAEFDSLTLTNLSLTSYTPKIGAAMTQATATAMPWAGALGMMFDGDLMPWGTAADAKCMHTGDGGSLGWQYRPTTLKAENRIVATAATAVGNVGVTVSCTNANTIRVRVMNGSGAYDYDSGDVACPIAINNTYTMVLRVASGAGGVSLRVNGTEIISGALTAPSAANATTGLMLGGDAVGAATNVTGYVGKALLVPRAITVAEAAQFEAYCAAGATL